MLKTSIATIVATTLTLSIQGSSAGQTGSAPLVNDTPENAARAFCEAVFAKDVNRMAALILGGHADYSTFYHRGQWPFGVEDRRYPLRVSRVQATRTGTKAVCRIVFGSDMPGLPAAYFETNPQVLDLTQTPLGWKVMPSLSRRSHMRFAWRPQTPSRAHFESDNSGRSNVAEGRALDDYASGFTTQGVMHSDWSGLDQLVLGLGQFLNDNNGKYPGLNTPANFKNYTAFEWIYPYIKVEEIMSFRSLVCRPTVLYRTEKGLVTRTISYNWGLAGRTVESIRQPSRTVLFSIGQRGSLQFPYDGKTLMAFADFSIRLVSRLEIAKLKWTAL